MIYDLTIEKAEALRKCEREGKLLEVSGLVRARSIRRRVWIRTSLMQELFGKNGGEPQHWAAADVQAFLKRFVQGEKMVMIFAERGLGAFPDFKLTKGGGSPFFEIRFDLEPNRPPQVRLFGRFIATDCFVITSIGEKGPTDTKGKTKTIDVAAHRKVCQRTFDNCDLTRTPWIPDPEGSMSSVEIAK